MKEKETDDFELIRSLALHIADTFAFAVATGCGASSGTHASKIFACVCAALCLSSGVLAVVFAKKVQQAKKAEMEKMFVYECEYKQEKSDNITQ